VLLCIVPVSTDDPAHDEMCGCVATGPGADAAVRALANERRDLATALEASAMLGAALRQRDTAIARAEAAERERDEQEAAKEAAYQKIHELRAEVERLTAELCCDNCERELNHGLCPVCDNDE
jgi:hypothetical protein